MRDGVEAFDVAGFRDADRVGAGHERGSGYAANGLGVEIGEAEPLGGHAVKVRGLDLGRTETAEICVTLVVGKDQDDVGAIGGAGDLSDQDERKKQQTFHFGVGGWWSLGIRVHSGGPQGRADRRGGRLYLGGFISNFGFGNGEFGLSRRGSREAGVFNAKMRRGKDGEGRRLNAEGQMRAG